MHASTTVTPSRLPELLLAVAVVRPVFVWGQPGIGKSSIVEEFARSLGMECVSLVGTQLAAEDLIGVPELIDTAAGRASRFAPPTMLAREDPFVLFLDELNSATHDVQKAFYSLILEQRIGELVLPKGSIVIGAGNRSQDNAITRPLPTALVNRMVHVHLEASARDWLGWAGPAGVHAMVLDYIRQRPDHLVAPPPKTEEPFSTPRSWHMLSDGLHSAAPQAGQISEPVLRVLADGCLSPAHARQFVGWARQVAHAWDLDAVLKGVRRWPPDPADRDLLYFLAQSFRARLAKELPSEKAGSSRDTTLLAHRAKALLVELAEISLEIAQLVVAPGGADGDGSDGKAVPDWFLVEVVRDLPRLARARG
jgi:hypothetical protein